MNKIILLTFLAMLAITGNAQKKVGVATAPADSVLPVSRRVVFCLSMLSNLPAATAANLLTDSLGAVKQIVQYAKPIIDNTLANAQDASVPGNTLELSNWTRAWGPAVITKLSMPIKATSLKVPEVRLVSAVSMTIFRDNHLNYVLAIQATNPYCPYAWETLDFNVKQTVPWTYTKGNTAQGVISLGTSIGLAELLQLQDDSTGTSMQQFLNANNGTLKNIIVTGHSLGGALSPVLALYLNNYYYDSVKIATPNIYCLSTAGATPGDTTFANYYDSVLQENTVRIWNQFDVVPHAWGKSLMLGMESSVNDTTGKRYGGIYSTPGTSLFFDSTYTACKPNARQPVPFIPMATPDDINSLINYALGKADSSGVIYEPICNGGISFPGAGARVMPDSVYINVAPMDSTIRVEMDSIISHYIEKPFNDSSQFLPELGAQHVAAYNLYFQMKGIHEYIKQLVDINTASIVNSCKWGILSATAKKGKKATVIKRSPFTADAWSVFLSAVYRKAWEW